MTWIWVVIGIVAASATLLMCGCMKVASECDRREEEEEYRRRNGLE